MGPLDIWMILAGWLGLLLPLPSLWWAWHRWANEARGRTSHDRTYRITLVSLGTASLAVACWIAAVLCFFKHRTMPFDVCERAGPFRHEFALCPYNSVCVVRTQTMSLDDYFLRNWSDPLLAVFRCRKGI